MSKSMFTLVLFLGLSLVLSGCGDKKQSAGAEKGNPAAGKVIASKDCVACHGLDGKGVTSDIPHLAAQVENYLVAALGAYRDGKRTHAALRDMATNMSKADIRNVAAFYASLPPIKTESVEEIQDIREKGQAAAQTCAACHGEDGNSTTAGIPTLAGQQPVYFISAVKSYLDGKRKMSSKEKGDMVQALNQVDIEAMALYYASTRPAKRNPPEVGNPAAGEPLSAECGSCHGAKGVSSDPKIPTLAGQDAQYLANAIKAYQDDSRHQEDMHMTLTKTSVSDIQHIAAFYSVQESRPAEEEFISMKDLADKCEHCHAPGMENPMMIFPKIRGQNRDYLIKALKAYRDNARGSSPMHKMSLPYSEAVIESIATWYANQPAN
ncbi:c-type cytochrome [Kaarinaea lacus]